MNAYSLTITNETQSLKLNNTAAGGERSSNSVDKKADKLLKTMFGYKSVKSNVDTLIAHRVSTVSLRTGSTEAQQRANFIYSVASQGFNIAESIVGGFMIGNAAGAAVGALMSISHTLLSYSLKQDTLNIQNTLERTQQNFSAQRATFSGSRYQRVLDE